MKKLLLLLLLAASPLLAQSPPVQYAENLPLASHSLLLDITATDDGFVAVGERGHVLLSRDGKQWKQPAEKTVPTRATLTAVTAKGRQLWAVGHDSVIIHSSDGGQHWERQFFDPEREQPLLDVYFDTPTQGWAMGAYGLLLKTTDGGAHWEEILLSDEFDFHLNGMARLSDGTRIIIAEAGNAWRKRPGDEAWSLLELPYPGSMFGVLALPGDRLVAMGLRGHVLESVDHGETWYQDKTGSKANLFGGSLGPDGSLAIVGAKGTVLLRQADAVDFTLHEMDALGDLAGVINLGGGQLIVVGERGVQAINTGKQAGQE